MTVCRIIAIGRAIQFGALVSMAILPVVPSDASAGLTKFDLVCSGKIDTVGDGPVVNSIARNGTFTSRLRFDLGARRFCLDDCSLVVAISKLDGKAITYHAGRGPARLSRTDPQGTHYALETDDIVVDRSTLNYRRTLAGFEGDFARLPEALIYSATCLRAPFSRFPDSEGRH